MEITTLDKCCCKKCAKVATPKPTEKAIEELSDSELTDKQKAFVMEYPRISNVTQVYINIYGIERKAAMTNESRMRRFNKKLRA